MDYILKYIVPFYLDATSYINYVRVVKVPATVNECIKCRLSRQVLFNELGPTKPYYYSAAGAYKSLFKMKDLLVNLNEIKGYCTILPSGLCHGKYLYITRYETYGLGEFSSGVRINKKFHYYFNKMCKSSAYFGGRKNGFSTISNSDGNILREQNYVNGIKNGALNIWYNTGALHYSVNFRDGIINGIYRCYNKNGFLAREYYFDMGLLEGVHRKWDENGEILYEISYINGLPLYPYVKWINLTPVLVEENKSILANLIQIDLIHDNLYTMYENH